MLEQALAGVLGDPVLESTLVEEIVCDVGDYWVATVLGTQDDAWLAFSLESHEEREVRLHPLYCCFAPLSIQDPLLLQPLLFEVKGDDWRQLERIADRQELPTVELRDRQQTLRLKHL